MKINSILDCINSKRDNAGNCYWAFRWTDCKTGKQVVGKISGGESNINCIKYEMNGKNFEPRDCYYTRHEMNKREFNNLTAGWNYAGCAPEELANFIKKELAK